MFRMRLIGIVVVFLAIAAGVKGWLIFHHPEFCHRDEDCRGFCPDGGRCKDNFFSKYCECSENHYVPPATTITIPSTPTTTKTTPTTTTTQPLVPLECSNRKIAVIESIAENLHVEDDRVRECPGTQKHQTSEAFIIHKCNSTTRSFWMPGPKTVKELCAEHTIAAYTPISTFYKDKINTAGFFIKCLENDDGIEIAFQNCQDPPKITMLNETTSPRMSDFYKINVRS